MTKKWKTLCQKEKLHVLCNFFFCHYVFKKSSAAIASKCVCRWERVNLLQLFNCFNVKRPCETEHILIPVAVSPQVKVDFLRVRAQPLSHIKVS